MKARYTYVLLLGCLAWPGTLLAAPQTGGGVHTAYTLLIGRPELGTARDGMVLVGSGTVVLPMAGEGRVDIEHLREKLAKAYRLESLAVRAEAAKRLPLNQETEMPAVDGLRISLTLVGYNESVVTYRVRIADGQRPLADTPVSFELGKPGVIGCQAGAEAPYLFVVLQGGAEESAAEPAGKPIQPLVVERVNPEYPEAARKAQIQGNVILEVAVFADGSAEVVQVVKSPHKLLSDAATQAVSRWRWLPGRDARGLPADMICTLTIKFLLAD